jgi:hypothetical protein
VTVSGVLFIGCYYTIGFGFFGFISTFITKRGRQRESEWLHEMSEGRIEEDIMRPARIREGIHRFSKNLIMWGLKGLVIGIMAKIVEGMIGL